MFDAGSSLRCWRRFQYCSVWYHVDCSLLPPSSGQSKILEAETWILCETLVIMYRSTWTSSYKTGVIIMYSKYRLAWNVFTASGYGLDDQEFWYRQGQELFRCSEMSGATLVVPKQCLIRWVPGFISRAWNCRIVILTTFLPSVGRDSSVGIATRYRMNVPGIASQWGRDFPHPPKPSLGPTQSPIQWVPCLFLSPGSKAAGSWSYQPTPLKRLKSSAIPLLPLCSFMAGYRMNFTFTFHLVPKLRMTGTILLLPLFAFWTWTQSSPYPSLVSVT